MSFFPVSFQNQTKPRIAIVGAGLAGLTAAYRLRQEGISFDLFEARKRAGGRVLTHYKRERHMELGGQVLNHGGEAKEIRALLAELGLETQSCEIPLCGHYLIDGKLHNFYELIRQAPPPTEKTHETLRSKIKTSHNMLEILKSLASLQPTLLSLLAIRLAIYEGSFPEELGTYCFDLFWDFYRSDHLHAIKEQKEPLSYQFDVIQGGGANLLEPFANS